MSGTTFTTYPVQSHKTTQTAPASGPGTDGAAALEKSYLSASSHATTATRPSAYAQHSPGPGLTTLALGEEDGGGMSMPAANGPMSTPQADSGFQVTTLAIGEEDGGGYGTMQPIRDDHSTIGGASFGNALPPVSGSGTSETYGRMQPIYSPGEAEYPAFARTSQTPDLLNFHPVARVPKTVIAPPAPATYAPVTVPAPVAAQPITMSAAPVGMQAEAVPQSGDYQTVGSYEEYVGGATSQPMTPAPAPVSVQTGAVYEPITDTGATVPTYAPVEAAPSQPVYETYQSAVETSTYDDMRAADMPAPAEAQPVYVEQQPVAQPAAAAEYVAPAPAPEYVAPTPAPAPEYVAPAPAPEYVAPAPAVEAYAPMTSVEPQQKPDIFVKDAPFDYTGAVEPADPADGNPDYAAPVEAEPESAPATGTAASQPEPVPAAAAPDADYISVSIDDYLVDPAGADTVSATPDIATAEPASTTDTPVAAPVESASTPPTPMAASEPVAEPTQTPSLGGSYRVIDSPLPDSVTGMSSGAGNAGPSAGPVDSPGNSLQIMTLSVGEESGAP